MRRKNHSLLRRYLIEIGVWPTGTPEEIKAATLSFKRNYQKMYHRTYRARKQEISTRFLPTEYAALNNAALKHRKSIPTFLHDGIMAYINNLPLAPTNEALYALEAVLTKSLVAIRELSEKDLPSEGNKYRQLECIVHRMSEELAGAFYHNRTSKKKYHEGNNNNE